MSEIELNFSGQEEYPTHIRMLVVGQPGVGKTTLASHFPNPLWVNAACGIPTLARIGGIPYINFSSEMDLFAVKELIDSGKSEELAGFPIETLVIDSVDELQRLLMLERLRNEHRSETKLEDWGWLNTRLHAIFSGLIQLPVNLVIISHTKEVNVNDDVIFKSALAGQFCEHIHEYVDMSLFMKASTITIDDEDDESSDEFIVDRWLLSTPLIEAEWINDKTGTLPHVLKADENIFNVITDSMKNVTLPKSHKVMVQIASEESDPEPEPEEDKPHTSLEEVKARRSNDTDDVCTECGASVKAKTWSDLSKMRFNTVLCGDCFKSKE